MDYAIYKSINDSHSHIVHRFTQADNNHHAMAAARKKLDEMWRRVLGRQPLYNNAESFKDGFAYDYMSSGKHHRAHTFLHRSAKMNLC